MLTESWCGWPMDHGGRWSFEVWCTVLSAAACSRLPLRSLELISRTTEWAC